MKKGLDIIVTLCALGAAVFFALTAGPQFLKLQRGAEALGEKKFAEGEDRYISYEAAYPVASQVEEYYSGDPDRARYTGYVVYDEARREFVYVVVSENDARDFDSLMRNLDAVSEMREGRSMEPVSLKGTLRAADETDARRILKALEESKIVDRYSGVEGQEEYFETYYGDEQGKLLTRMCQELAASGVQADWYVLENKKIDGLAFHEIWITFLAAALSFLIFVGKVISLVRGDRKAGKKLPESADKMDRLMEAQRGWVTDWCRYGKDKASKQMYLTVAGCVAVLVAIGFLANGSLQQIMTLHLPVGVLFGEGVAVFFWLTMGGRSNPDKVLKGIKKSLNKEFSSPGERERFAEDILEAGPEWNFQEKTKDSLIRGTMGSRYWAVFMGGGITTVVDSDRVGALETEHVTERVRSGKVRLSYEYYVVRFIDRDSGAKKTTPRELSFRTEDGKVDFMVLAGRRKGNEIKINER